MNASIDLLRKRLAPPLSLALLAYFYGRFAVDAYLFRPPQDAHFGLACAVVVFEVLYLAVTFALNRRWSVSSYLWLSGKVFATAIIITLVGLYAFVDMGLHATVMRSISGGVKQFGLAHFEELDADHNGTISGGDLLAYNPEGLGAIDKAMFDYMSAHFEEVGHVVSAENRQYKQTSWSQADTSKPASYPIVTYGIDKTDLTTFPERALGVLKDW